jgi:hypothetical protein
MILTSCDSFGLPTTEFFPPGEFCSQAHLHSLRIRRRMDERFHFVNRLMSVL